MRLLISVRSAEEVAAALRGGADIIDAKEPERGSLGAVKPEVLRAIAAEVPADTELSVAMGDFSSPAQVITAIDALPVSPRQQPLYLKLGFAGIGSGEQISDLLAAARVIARKHPASPRIIPVAYADAGLAGTAEPATVVKAAGVSGCAGFLLDTHEKGGANLLDWISPDALSCLIGEARELRLLCAIAGGLRREDLDLVAGEEPDVVGFRSAACRGGRSGQVSSLLVGDLRDKLDRLNSGFLQGPSDGPCQLRETPVAGAKLFGLT